MTAQQATEPTLVHTFSHRVFVWGRGRIFKKKSLGDHYNLKTTRGARDEEWADVQLLLSNDVGNLNS